MKDSWVPECEAKKTCFVLVSPLSNETLPHVDGHGGEQILKGETEPVQSITHLLDHTETHVLPCLEFITLA